MRRGVVSTQTTTDMRILTTIITLMLCSTIAVAQMRRNSAYNNYIDQYKDIAIEQMLRHNIPASITLAQGLLESNAGMSVLATKGNNHFGIKCHDWTGKKMHKDDDARNDCFRVYGNARESYEDHSQFLQRNRYQRLFKLKRNDYVGWARGLKACGYATNPQYAQLLINIIETYRLYDYDKAKSYDPYMAKHGGKYAGKGANAYEIRSNNKNYYVVARTGDTFKSIGKAVGVGRRKLAKYNERDVKDNLEAGEIIYLKKKRSRAEKAFKGKQHTISSGESMYSISQKYGITLKSLYKKNRLSADYAPKVGDKLKVY